MKLHAIIAAKQALAALARQRQAISVSSSSQPGKTLWVEISCSFLWMLPPYQPSVDASDASCASCLSTHRRVAFAALC